MAVEEQRRRHLLEWIASSAGAEAADTMSELLPPAGADVSTTADLAGLDQRMAHRFEQVDRRFQQVDRRFEQVDRRFEQVDQRFEQVDQRFEQVDRRFEQVDQRFEQVDRHFDEVDKRLGRLEDGLQGIWRELVALHGELARAVSGQTRAMLLGVITAVVGIAVLSLAFAQL